MLNRIIINNDKVCNINLGIKIGYKECQNTMDKLKNEIEQHLQSY